MGKIICIKDSLPVSYHHGKRYHSYSFDKCIIKKGEVILKSQMSPNSVNDDEVITIKGYGTLPSFSYIYMAKNFKTIEEFRDNKIEDVLS